MRTKGQKNGIKCRVYAGTTTVMVAMDVERENLRKDLLGFTIHCTILSGKYKGESKPLQNLLHFKNSGLKAGNAGPSTESPFQKFRWGDYGAYEDTQYSYRVDAFYGPLQHPRIVEGPTVKVKTHSRDEEHFVIFNRAVVASQAFWRHMHEWLNIPEGAPLPKFKKGTPLPAKAYTWLSRGVRETIEGFIEKADGPSKALDIAIYEYQFPAFAELLKTALDKGAHIRLLYHAKPRDKKTTPKNKKTLKDIPLDGPNIEIIPRVPASLMHDKFMVLSDYANNKRTPTSFLTGSTNWTENGVYRQANVIHVGRDPAIAKSYLDCYETIVRTARKAGDTRKWITANNKIDPTKKMFAAFSPRTGQSDLKEMARTIGSAKNEVFFATAFQLHPDIEKALIGKANDPVLRLGVQDKAKGKIAGVHRDRTKAFVASALFGTDADDWFKQRGSAGQEGSLYIHLKAIVVDFTSNNPTVISGSHNLSKAASGSNDENHLIMRGNVDLADMYGLEVMRFYDHYRFRDFLAKLKKKKLPAPRNFLVEDASWTDDYFDEENLMMTERVSFIG